MASRHAADWKGRFIFFFATEWGVVKGLRARSSGALRKSSKKRCHIQDFCHSLQLAEAHLTRLCPLSFGSSTRESSRYTRISGIAPPGATLLNVTMKLLPHLVVLACAATASLSAQEKPNVLFVIADDQCFRTIEALGMENIETPNLNRLVEKGTTFTHAYNMGSWSGAVCTASRHMLNTGAFVWHAEAISNSLRSNPKPSKTAAPGEWPNFQEQGLMWSQLMSKAGYDTYFTGKWHVNASPPAIFDTTANIRAGMPKQTETGYNRPIDGQPDPWDPTDPKFGGFWEGGKHWSEVVADDAETFLTTAAQEDDPFFMYVAFNAPHDPRQAPQEFVDRYPVDSISMPPNFLPMYPWKDQIDNPATLRDEKLAPFPRTPASVKVHRQEYYAIITHMDREIGRILDKLEASGKADNTWIFFTADHGLAVGEHGLMGKQNMFDHSVRVPFMVVGPGVKAGKKIDAPIYLQDVMPTALELAGAEKPDHVQFKSILPILAGEADGYDAIYGAYLQSQRSVAKDGYKLILYPKVPKYIVYHTAEDPSELNDLAGTPEGDVKAKELFPIFQALQKENGDQLDLSETFADLL